MLKLLYCEQRLLSVFKRIKKKLVRQLLILLPCLFPLFGIGPIRCFNFEFPSKLVHINKYNHSICNSASSYHCHMYVYSALRSHGRYSSLTSVGLKFLAGIEMKKYLIVGRWSVVFRTTIFFSRLGISFFF